MFKTLLLLLSFAIISASNVRLNAQSIRGPDTVEIASEGVKLRGLIWRPVGQGPFPAMLFTLGSFADSPDGIGRLFARRNYVFLFLFPRGLGLSADRGTKMADLLAEESARHGLEARDRLYVKLLETDHLADGIAALAFLRGLPDVDPVQVAAAGHSGGGSLALLLAERDHTLRAVVNFAGAARNWERNPLLRTRLVEAARGSAVPVMLVYAANDASLAPAKALAAEMNRQGRAHRVRIYPRFGHTTDEGHRLVFLSTSSWEHDVFAFLSEYMGH